MGHQAPLRSWGHWKRHVPPGRVLSVPRPMSACCRDFVQIWHGQSWGRERGLCELSRDRKQTWGLSFASYAHCVGGLLGWGRLSRFFSAASAQPDPKG